MIPVEKIDVKEFRLCLLSSVFLQIFSNLRVNYKSSEVL